jgi:hypothetical protein
MANGARTLKQSFTYDTVDTNKLVGVTDADGNFVSIGRANGNIQILPAVGGSVIPTTIYTDANGYAQRVQTPGGGQWYATTSSTGLLQTLVDSRGTGHVFTYNELGELLTDGIQRLGESAVAFYQSLDFTSGQGTPGSSNSSTRTTVHTSGAGLKTTYEFTRDSGGVDTRKVTLPDQKLYTTTAKSDGTVTTSMPDGTVLQSVPDGIDPVFPDAVQLPLNRIELPYGPTLETRVVRSNSVLDPAGIDTYTVTSGSRQATYKYTPSTNTLVTQTPAGRQYTKTFDSAGHILRIQEQDVQASTFVYSTQQGVHGLLSNVTQYGGGTTLKYGENGNPPGFLTSATSPFAKTSFNWKIYPGATQLVQTIQGQTTTFQLGAVPDLLTESQVRSIT